MNEVRMHIKRKFEFDFGFIGIVLLIIAVLAAVGLVAWLLLSVALKVIGWLLLIAMAAFGTFILTADQKPAPVSDPAQSGIHTIADRIRLTQPDVTDELVYNRMILGHVAMLVFLALLAVTVIVYASDPTYQHVPVNYIGGATFAAVIALVIRFSISFLRMPKLLTEPAPRKSLMFKLLTYAAAPFLIVYPCCLLLTNFGIL